MPAAPSALNGDCLRRICIYLPHLDILSFSSSCRAARDAVADNILWEELCRDRHAVPEDTRPAAGLTWRRFFASLGRGGQGRARTLLTFGIGSVPSEVPWAVDEATMKILSEVRQTSNLVCYVPLYMLEERQLVCGAARGLGDAGVGCVGAFPDQASLGVVCWPKSVMATTMAGSASIALPRSLFCLCSGFCIDSPHCTALLAQQLLRWLFALCNAVVIVTSDVTKQRGVDWLHTVLPPHPMNGLHAHQTDRSSAALIWVCVAEEEGVRSPQASPTAAPVTQNAALEAVDFDTESVEDLEVEEFLQSTSAFRLADPLAAVRVLHAHRHGDTQLRDAPSGFVQWVLDNFGVLKAATICVATQEGDELGHVLGCRWRELLWSSLCPEPHFRIVVPGGMVPCNGAAVAAGLPALSAFEMNTSEFYLNLFAPEVRKVTQFYFEAMSFEMLSHSLHGHPDARSMRIEGVELEVEHFLTSTTPPILHFSVPAERLHLCPFLPFSSTEMHHVHQLHSFGAFRGFCATLTAYGLYDAHAAQALIGYVKTGINGVFRAFWRANWSMSKRYCRELARQTFQGFKHRLSATPAAAAAASGKIGKFVLPFRNSTSDSVLAAHWIRSAFNAVVEEYTMKGRGPQIFECLSEAIRDSLGSLEGPLKTPFGDLSAADVAHTRDILEKEITEQAADAIKEADAKRASLQWEAALETQAIGIDSNMDRCRARLETMSRSEGEADAWFARRGARMASLGIDDPNALSAPLLERRASTDAVLAALTALCTEKAERKAMGERRRTQPRLMAFSQAAA